MHPRAAASVVALLLAAASAAQSPRPPETTLQPPGPPQHPTREITAEEAERERTRLNKEVGAAFLKHDYARAEALLRELVPLDHENFVPWYNLACALSMQGKAEEGLKMIEQAVARGFADLRQMQTDEHLAAVRALPAYKDLVAAWSRLDDARTEARIEKAKKAFHVGEHGSPYVTSKDEALRLVYISAFDPVLFQRAQEEAKRLTKWWTDQVAPPTPSIPAALDTPASSPRHPATPPPPQAPWVLVVFPTRPDFRAWADQRFGDLADRVGGEYSHDQKQLVAMDLGSTWRHEFWHVLHWRDMDARGQRHPLWVMEGLCSLVEDVDAGPDGRMVPRPSWRTNMAKRIARAGALTPWEVLFAADRARFVGSRPLASYAQARAVFLFLADRGRLRDWYAAYVATCAEDPTGAAAMVRVFGQPLKATEKEFRAWLRELPEAAAEIGRGPANLPFDVGPGAGDGPTVDIDPLDALRPGGGTPAAAGLRAGDVITSVNGRDVRDLYDLARALADFEPGAQVRLAYRRGKTHGEATVKLVPPR
jgi:hypothetical protein